MKSSIRTVRAATLWFAALYPLYLATPASATDTDPLFAKHRIIEATIEAPIGRIMTNRIEEEELDGTFTYKTADGGQQELAVKVKIRGNFRADKNVCDFAPLRLNFKKKQVADTEFAGQDKLKLVTHCLNKVKAYEQLLLKEYLAYRILSAVTDNAFRVRLLRITYKDSEHRSPSRTNYAFLIEHRKKLAARIGMQPGDTEAITYVQLDDAQTNLLTVYAYLIGNTDFSAVKGPKDDRCCHNVELFKNDDGKYVPIPYDFDFAGIVNAPYAAPNPRLGIGKVTQRRYRGLCKNNVLLDRSFALFNNHHAEIISMIDGFKPLDSSTRIKVRRFVERFYKDAGNDGKVDKYFVNKCSTATAPPSAS